MLKLISSFDTGQLVALATIASGIASLALVLTSIWLAILTKALAREARLAREVSDRADVQCSAQPHEEHMIIIELVVVNIGRGSATDVKVSFGPVMRTGVEQTSTELTFARFLPGASFRVTLGSYVELQEKTVSAEISFTDKFGTQHFSYKQDLTVWLGASRVSDHPQYAASQALGEISKTLDRVARAGRLEVNVFDADDRDAESKRLKEM